MASPALELQSRLTTVSAPPEQTSGVRIPSLDGLRALSIILVLLGHLSGTTGFVRLDPGIGDYSHLGVVVFFVISGFLITQLLLSEYQRKGSISLKRFYIRRSLRLFPAAFFYTACVCGLWALQVIHLRWRDVAAALTYTVNFLPGRSWELGHLWSLSVEEQFYLLWPVAMVIARPRRAAWVALGVLALGPVARACDRLFLIGTPWHDLEMFPMLADTLATGCLLAHLRVWLESQPWYRGLFRPLPTLGLICLVLTINRYMDYSLVSIFGTSILNVALAILIHRFGYCHRDWAGRLLNWKPLATLGVYSYSLYLWQQIFLNRNSIAWTAAFPQNIIFVVILATASYVCLEKPLLELRHRLRT